jgi:hypothetical protein
MVNYGLEDACKRGILELILTSLHNKYKNKIAITFPTEVRETHNEFILDYTNAHVAIENEKLKPFFGDVRLHFKSLPSTLTLILSNNENMTLKVGQQTIGYPLQHTTHHIALTDPECHVKAIQLISESIEKLIKDLL